VSPFELQAVSPANPVSSPPYADIRYAGVSWNAGLGLLLFGISTVGDWSSLNEVAFNICIDNNEDGTYDFELFNSNGGTLGGSTSPQDTFMVAFRDLTSGATSINVPPLQPNRQPPSAIDSAHLLNNVIVLPISPTNLGFAGGDTTFRWKIVTCPGGSACARSVGANDHCSPAAGTFFDSVTGPFFFNWAAPGLDFSGAHLLQDLVGASIPVTVNTANMATNGSLGALLLHHHNTEGTRAEVVLLDTAPRADLSITKSFSPPNPGAGQTVTVTVTVTNNGPGAASGIQVNDFLPTGLTWVSDDSSGAYDPATGLWTIAALANGASATLTIMATVDITDQICNLAQITASTPLDPNQKNNQAEACVQAPRTADLAITVTRGGPATVTVGTPVPWTLTITNNGNDPAYAVVTTESFSPVSVVATATPPAEGVYTAAATGNWKVSSLGPGVTLTLNYSITAPNMAGVLTNTGTTLSTKSAHGKAFDPDNSDNTDSDIVTIISPASIGTHSKTVSGNFSVGGSITYTVVISNPSAFDQQDNPGDEFTDVLPAQLTLTGASASSGTATTGGNTAHWNGVIPAGGQVTITITATVSNGTPGQTICNQGTISFDADGNGTNESTQLTDDPGTAAVDDPTCFQVTTAPVVPTLSGLGLAALALLLAGGAFLALRRRQQA